MKEGEERGRKDKEGGIEEVEETWWERKGSESRNGDNGGDVEWWREEQN